MAGPYAVALTRCVTVQANKLNSQRIGLRKGREKDFRAFVQTSFVMGNVPHM